MADSDNESVDYHREHMSSPRELDSRLLPVANVSRIMKKALPPNVKISKGAKETVQECVSEFISFITGEASDKCQREKRKTINGDDLLWGMKTLGFEEYVDPLQLYLHKFRDMEEDKIAMAGRGDHRESGGGGAAAVMTMGNNSSDQGNYQGLYGFNVIGHQGGSVNGYGSGSTGGGGRW